MKVQVYGLAVILASVINDLGGVSAVLRSNPAKSHVDDAANAIDAITDRLGKEGADKLDELIASLTEWETSDTGDTEAKPGATPDDISGVHPVASGTEKVDDNQTIDDFVVSQDKDTTPSETSTDDTQPPSSPGDDQPSPPVTAVRPRTAVAPKSN